MQKSLIELVLDYLKNKGYKAEYMEKYTDHRYKNYILFLDNKDNNIKCSCGINIDEMIFRGCDAKKIADNIIAFYQEYIKTPQYRKTLLLQDKEYVLSHLHLCLRSKTNDDCIKRDFLDLEQYVQILITDNGEITDGVTITSAALGIYDISEEELFQKAYEQTKDRIQSLLQTKISDDGICSMVIRSAEYFGASAICFLDVLDKIASAYDSDIIIIPSSIHECMLIVGDNNFSIDNEVAIQSLICDVNKQLYPDEVLSDHPYLYDRKTKQLYSDFSIMRDRENDLDEI